MRSTSSRTKDIGARLGRVTLLDGLPARRAVT